MIADPPKDSVSAMRWSKQGNGQHHLAATTWDGMLTIYEHDGKGQCKVLGQKPHPSGSPALCVDWSDDGTKVFAGYGDNTAYMLDLGAGGGFTPIAKHDAPIKSIF